MSLARDLTKLAFGCLVAACGGGDLSLPGGDAGPAEIDVIDGDGQRGAVGEPLAAPVVVEVTDAAGRPVEGVTVQFALTSAGNGAGITPSTARTNAEGRAQAQVQLGDKVGIQTGEARVAGDGDALPKTSFSALAESPGNAPPTADFGWLCDGLTCQFTDASADSDGSLAAWSWRFGDGGISSDQAPSHTYAVGGAYTVRLMVTDDGGETGELSDVVTVTAPAVPPSNEDPRAEFDVACDDLTCTFTDRSEDDDGTIQSRLWAFGDGATSSDVNPTHAYQSAGRYEVVLSVRDDEGAEDTRTRTAQAEEPAPPPPNEPPHAEFEVHCDHLTCEFEDRSEDRDGTLASWQWSFGDGSTSSEQNPVHTYPERGHYDVLLTVTDDRGASDTKDRRADAKD